MSTFLLLIFFFLCSVEQLGTFSFHPGTPLFCRRPAQRCTYEILKSLWRPALLLLSSFFFPFSFFSNFIRRSLHLLVGCCLPAPACPLVVSSFFFSFRQMNYKHRYKSQRETHARHPFYSPFLLFLCLSSEIFRTRRGAMGRQTPKASTFFLGFFFSFFFLFYSDEYRACRLQRSAAKLLEFYFF